jgi:anti-sigma factor RsiW
VICRDARAWMSAYVDRELDVATSVEMEEHVAGCRECATAVQQAENLRAAIRSSELTYAPPGDLAARVRGVVRREARPRSAAMRAALRWAPVPAAAAAAALVAWITVVGTGDGGNRRLQDELVGGHVRSLMVDHLVDVASTDQHTVKPWFNGKIDFAPPVADFGSSGFPLVGGRVDYIGGRPVAALVYRHQQHVVNVFIWPGGGPDAAPQEASSQGYHLLRWSDGGLDYWAVSDLNARELGVLADRIREPHG